MAGEEVPEFEIRLMKENEIPQALDVWRDTTLSEGTHSIDTWYKYDPEGFYVAVTKDGTVIGTCAGVLQHADLAFIGLYAVRPAYQGKGIGKQIWAKVMERIGDRNAGVNPVEKMLENYRDKAGFPVQSDFCSVVCIAEQVPTEKMIQNIAGIAVENLCSKDTKMADAVVQYDSEVLGFEKERFIPILCDEVDSVTMVAYDKCNESVCGYGAIRTNIKGNALLGPLFAEEANVAELILYHLVKSFPLAQSKGVTIMIVDCNESAIALVEKLGFVRYRGTARLYRREEVNVQFGKVFAQNNLNFSVF